MSGGTARPPLRTRLGVAGATCMLLAAGYVLVHLGGGTNYGWQHALHLPVLLAAWAFGVRGGVAAGVAAGLLVGPRLPADIATATVQAPTAWLLRLLAFVAIGGLAGVLFTALRRRAATLVHTEGRVAALVRHVPDLVVVYADDGTVRYATPSVTTILGRAVDDVIGAPVRDLVHPNEAAMLDPSGPQGGTPLGRDVRFRHRDGSWRQLEVRVTDLRDDPAVEGVILNGRDVTERHAVEAELRYHATHDPLTGLINRTTFRHLLAARLASASGPLALILFHLDHLPDVLWSYGHNGGEQVLRIAARRLRELQRPDDLLCYYGDAELALLRADVGATEDPIALADRLRVELGTPLTLAGEHVTLPCSAGVALSDDAEGGTADGLLGDAYAALREARRRGGARTVRYAASLRKAAPAWLRTDAALRRALDRGDLRLHYQPILDLDSGRLAGFEALLRWHHPEHGVVAPAEFVPIAERSGAIVPIGAWVLAEACAQLARWQDRLPAPEHVVVAVNVSPRQLESCDLAGQIGDALRLSGIAAHQLALEVTESAVMTNLRESLERLEELRRLGLGLAIDDFGTGYASLEHLRALPVDTLKIDQVFVRGLEAVPGGDPIVSAVVGLARSLGLRTIAEGVERSEQAEALRALGCDGVQGYLYAHPEPPETLDLDAFAGTRRRLTPFA